jgi:hypothetical protein
MALPITTRTLGTGSVVCPFEAIPRPAAAPPRSGGYGIATAWQLQHKQATVCHLLDFCQSLP